MEYEYYLDDLEESLKERGIDINDFNIVEKQETKLDNLFDGYEDTKVKEIVDWGPDVGNERFYED